MHLLVHDYSGHPFPIELSRELARRGYEVTHIYCASFTAPRGLMAKMEDDPPHFHVIPISFTTPVPKFSFLKRWYWDQKYGKKLVEVVKKAPPFDLVLSGNAPLEAQKRLLAYSKKRDIPFIYWVQDLMGEGIHRIVAKKIPILGHFVGAYYRWLERHLFDQSDYLIAISPDFLPYFGKKNEGRSVVIENWAPQYLLKQVPKDNPWARKYGLADKFVFLYTGTLGFKHNPRHLLELAAFFKKEPQVRVVVNSEGEVADWLKREAKEQNLENLIVNPFQPITDMPLILGAADVLVVLLEPDAGIFSVPSKIYAYLCAGKPVLLSVPLSNLAARLTLHHQFGYVVSPEDLKGFLIKAHALYEDEGMRKEMGQRALMYANERFHIQRIGDQFEEVICQVVGKLNKEISGIIG